MEKKVDIAEKPIFVTKDKDGMYRFFPYNPEVAHEFFKHLFGFPVCQEEDEAFEKSEQKR